MLQPPPGSTLFPYTTLFRSIPIFCAITPERMWLTLLSPKDSSELDLDIDAGGEVELHQRSEEHTSELQSLAYLVCRLLLEKKKHGTNITLRLTTLFKDNLSA